MNTFHFRVSSPPTWRVSAATVCGVWIVAALFAVHSALSKYQCENFAGLIHITYLQLMFIFELYCILCFLKQYQIPVYAFPAILWIATANYDNSPPVGHKLLT